MAEKVALVTGASSGIGRAIAQGLAERGYHVAMVARHRGRGEAARAQVAAASGNPHVDLLLADLASQGEVRALADAFRARHRRLDVLVNNAGGIFGRREVTPEGLEHTFALNHMAYFLLANLLEDLLRASAPARVINVASEAHRYGWVKWSDLQRARGYTAWGAYAQSKLCNILFTKELARRLAGSGVTANCMHPGVVASRFGQSGDAPTRLGMLLARPFLVTPARASETAVWLATAPELAEVSGRYFARRRERTPSRAARDPAAARRLWEESARLARLPAG